MNVEISINLECPPSRFGENCRRNCSFHCVIPGICDRVEGQCLGGCQAGWQNTQCDQGKK